jgi:hypothetical protein
MFTSVGRYHLQGGAVEVCRHIEQGLIPLLCRQAGFQSCSVLTAGSRTLVTLLVFTDRAAAEAGVRLAKAWMELHLARLVSLQDTTSGEVAIHAGAWL